MKKVIVTLCIIIACILILTSFNPVIGFFSLKNYRNEDSPLFTVRIQRVQKIEPSSLTTQYIGKDEPIDVILPTRYMIQQNMLKELSNVDIQKKIGNANQEILNTWHFVLQVAENNLATINEILREASVEFRNLIEKYLKLADDELKQVFLTNLNELTLQEYTFLSIYSPQMYTDTTNITSGFFCNITTGPVCRFTSQPICELTSQPICDLITLMPPCLTLMGLRCPSAGLKCNSPTTGKICEFLIQLGPLLKAIAIILIIALILFIPLIIIISVLNANACANIRDQITYVFNCTTPE